MDKSQILLQLKGKNMNKKMNKGMAALKKEAPAVAAKMGYKYGGMAKKKSGYNKGGMANCGASMKPTQGKK